MNYNEFNEISEKTCAPEMFKEIERVYMTFLDITKKEISVMYWGDKPNCYGLWRKALNLANELNNGFENEVQLNIWINNKNELIKNIKGMKIK